MMSTFPRVKRKKLDCDFSVIASRFHTLWGELKKLDIPNEEKIEFLSVPLMAILRITGEVDTLIDVPASSGVAVCFDWIVIDNFVTIEDFASLARQLLGLNCEYGITQDENRVDSNGIVMFGTYPTDYQKFTEPALSIIGKRNNTCFNASEFTAEEPAFNFSRMTTELEFDVEGQMTKIPNFFHTILTKRSLRHFLKNDPRGGELSEETCRELNTVLSTERLFKNANVRFNKSKNCTHQTETRMICSFCRVPHPWSRIDRSSSYREFTIAVTINKFVFTSKKFFGQESHDLARICQFFFAQVYPWYIQTKSTKKNVTALLHSLIDAEAANLQFEERIYRIHPDEIDSQPEITCPEFRRRPTFLRSNTPRSN